MSWGLGWVGKGVLSAPAPSYSLLRDLKAFAKIAFKWLKTSINNSKLIVEYQSLLLLVAAIQNKVPCLSWENYTPSSFGQQTWYELNAPYLKISSSSRQKNLAWGDSTYKAIKAFERTSAWDKAFQRALYFSYI